MEVVELLPPKVYSFTLTLLHSEWPKLHGVLAILSSKGLTSLFYVQRRVTAFIPTDLHLSILPLRIFIPSMTMRAAMIALVVAIAGMILPAIAEKRSIL